MEKYNVVILTGGLGTRLHKYTANLYPKILISLGNETMLDRIIHYYKNVEMESFKIVVSSEENKKIIENYLSVNHSDFINSVWCDVILYPKLDGSFMTIYKTQKGQGIKNMILHWSDIVPLQNNVFDLCYNTDISVAFDNEPRHRITIESFDEYKSVNVRTSPNNMGNIPGYFFVSNFDKTFTPEVFEQIVKKYKSKKEIDFTDALQYLSKKPITLGLTPCDFIDIGDSEKYEKFMSDVSLDTRSFNSIEFKDDQVIKKPLNDAGADLMSGEFYWYLKTIQDISNPPIPKLYGNSSATHLSMKQITGLTVDQYLQLFPNELEKVISLFNNTISLFHKNNTSDLSDHVYETNIEYQQLTHKRIADIDYALQRNVDSIHITTKSLKGKYYFKKYSIFSTITDAYNHIIEKYDTDYGKDKFAYIHGDTNTSNVMIDNYDKMILIDPRGKFGGKVSTLGDIHYDWAKFIYGLQGYSRFSTDTDFILSFDDDLDRLTLDMAKYQIADIDTVLGMIKEIRPDLDTTILRLLVGIIHIKLGAYIKNNLSKSIATVQYGRYILETTLL